VSSFLVFIKNFAELLGIINSAIKAIKDQVDAKELNKAIKKATDTSDTSDLEQLFSKSKK